MKKKENDQRNQSSLDLWARPLVATRHSYLAHSQLCSDVPCMSQHLQGNKPAAAPLLYVCLDDALTALIVFADVNGCAFGCGRRQRCHIML